MLAVNVSFSNGDIRGAMTDELHTCQAALKGSY